MISHCFAVIRVDRNRRLLFAFQQRRGDFLLDVLDLSQDGLHAPAATQQQPGQQD